MICNICGAENPDSTLYCVDCGAKLITPVMQNAQTSVGSTQGPQNVQPSVGNVQGQQYVQTTVGSQQTRLYMPNVNQQMQPDNANSNYNNRQAKKHTGIGIAITLILLVLVVGILLFVLPLLLNKKLSGRYHSDELKADIIFDNGVYAIYNDYESIEFGTYELDGQKIIFTSLNGNKDYGTYDKRKNSLEYGYTFKSVDKKAGFDKDIDEAYVTSLRGKLEDAAEQALEDDAAYTDARSWNSDYYIRGDMLSTSDMEYIKEFADCLNYNSDDKLSYLLEHNYLSFNLELNLKRDEATITFY